MAKQMRKIRVGAVVRTRMDKTAVVEMVWKQRHTLYSKQMRRVARFYVHDPENQCQIGGSEVEITLFAGNHKSFVSGADISELRDRRRQDALIKINSGLFHKIETFPSPTIAAVEGWALGGGCELAMACDIRVVGKSARIGQPEVSLGIIPGAGGCIRLPKLVGIGKAREMIFTGMILDATEARVLGWANHLVKMRRSCPCRSRSQTRS